MSSEPRHVRTPANAADADALSDVLTNILKEAVRMSSEPRHVRTPANAAAADALPDVLTNILKEAAV